MDRKIAKGKQSLTKLAEAGQIPGEAFAELRRTCEEEDYIREIPPGQEWPNPFPDVLDESRLGQVKSAL